MNWHDVIDERSLELDRVIADKIRANPALYQVVRDNLKRWLKTDDPDPSIVEWQEFIDSHTMDEVLDFICSWSDESRRMRQSSPFCGILSHTERMEIFKKYEPLRT